MPRPTSWSSVSAITPSSNPTINALLGSYRWLSSSISYSYPEYSGSLSWSTNVLTGYGATSGSREPWSSSFSPLSTYDRTSLPTALQQWANVSNLRFSLVSDNIFAVGDIRAAYTYIADQNNFVAWAYYPAATSSAGDVWFNAYNSAAFSIWTPGNYAYFSVLHELGHALGLKHPFEGTSQLQSSLDTQSYTIMSYSAQPGVVGTTFSYYPTTPMLFDIAAIQHVYGANYSHNAGNNTYSFSDSETYHQTIWDAGGNDTIRYTGIWNSSIDLRAGYGKALSQFQLKV